MTRGRKPKPSAIKIAEGNRRKVRADTIKPDIIGKGEPSIPAHLSPEERLLWAEVARSLPAGMLTAADNGVIERYVVAWATFQRVGLKIQRTGDLVKSPQGPIRNPLLAIRNSAAKEMQSAGSELGLSPASRSRLSQAGLEEDDPMALLLGMIE